MGPNVNASLLIVLRAKDEAEATLKRAEGNISGIGKAAAALAATAVVAGVGIGAAAAKMATDFQAAMELVHTQAGASQQEVENLKDAVLALAPTVGVGPVRLAEGLYHLESAGFRGKVAMDALAGAAKLAQVGHAGLEETTQAVVGTLASFPQYAGHVNDVLGILNATVGSGDMRMEGFAKALSTGILPAAATFGLGMKDVGAALATLTDNVTPPEEAATRLRMTFAMLAAPSGKAADTLKKIGISATELGQDMRKPDGLLNAVGDLREHLIKSFGPDAMNQVNQYVAIMKKDGPAAADKFAAQAAGAAETISHAFGGGRTAGAIETLLQEFDRFKDKYKAITDGSHSFEDAWEHTKQTFAQQMASLRASLDSWLIRIGSVLLPLLSQLVGWVQQNVLPALQRFGSWFAQNGVPMLVAFGHALLTVAQVLGDVLGPPLKFIADHFSVIGPLLVGVIAGFVALNTVMLAMRAIQGLQLIWATFAAILAGEVAPAEAVAATGAVGLGAAIDVMMGPIGIAIAVIAAVVAAVVLMVTHWSDVKRIAGEVAGAVRDFLVKALQELSNIGHAIGKFFQDLPVRIREALRAVGVFLLGLLRDLGQAMLRGAEAAGRLFLQGLEHLPQLLGNLLSLLVNAALQGMVDLLGAFLWLPVHAIETVVRLGIDLGVALVNGLKALPGLALGAFVLMGKLLLDYVTKFIPFLVTSYIKLLMALPGFVWNILTDVIGTFGRWGGDALDWAVHFIPHLLETILGFLGSLPGKAAAAIGSLVGILGKVWNDVKAGAGAVWGEIASIPGHAFDGAKAVFTGAINGVIWLLNKFIDFIDSINVTIPDWVPLIGGKGFHPQIPHIPSLAQGAVILPRPGGTLVRMAEAGLPEAAVPLDRADDFGFGGGGGGVGGVGGGGVVVPVTLMLDGKVLTRVVVKRAGKNLRHQGYTQGSNR